MKYDIYLASGWFNEDQMSKMKRVLEGLRTAGFSVFAPFESDMNQKENEAMDRGVAKLIYKDDINGIESSRLMLAIYDNTDSGTMMEIGYAIGIKKDVVVVSSEDFMNLMISVPVNGVYHSFEELEETLKTVKTVEEIIENSKEWSKSNF